MAVDEIPIATWGSSEIATWQDLKFRRGTRIAPNRASLIHFASYQIIFGFQMFERTFRLNRGNGWFPWMFYFVVVIHHAISYVVTCAKRCKQKHISGDEKNLKYEVRKCINSREGTVWDVISPVWKFGNNFLSSVFYCRFWVGRSVSIHITVSSNLQLGNKYSCQAFRSGHARMYFQLKEQISPPHFKRYVIYGLYNKSKIGLFVCLLPFKFSREERGELGRGGGSKILHLALSQVFRDALSYVQ